MLTVDNLSVSFRRYLGFVRQDRIACLRSVSLSIERGELIAIIGASGAGKSLLAHAIVGILPGHAEIGGRMTLSGTLLTPARQAKIRGRQIALVPQSITCLDPLARVGRQMEIAARRAGLQRSTVADTIDRFLSGFGLAPDVRRSFPHELSGGMARRVLLATATIGEPDVVIADEPTTGLDDETALPVLRHLRQLADRDKAVLMISHDLRAALTVADRVVVIRDGISCDTVSASSFASDGTALSHGYTRALWRALPEHDFDRRAGKPMDAG
jgi:peptide/nickel transport system ATP-binding protein